jgi:hypothetical protein
MWTEKGAGPCAIGLNFWRSSDPVCRMRDTEQDDGGLGCTEHNSQVSNYAPGLVGRLSGLSKLGSGI